MSHLESLKLPALGPVRAQSLALPYAPRYDVDSYLLLFVELVKAFKDDTAAWDAVRLEPLRLRDEGEHGTLAAWQLDLTKRCGASGVVYVSSTAY